MKMVKISSFMFAFKCLTHEKVNIIYSTHIVHVYYGAFRVESCLALCSGVFFFFLFFCFFFCFFFSPLSIAISLGEEIERERELVYVLHVRLFVLNALMFCSSFLPLGVWDWLRLVIVAIPGRSC